MNVAFVDTDQHGSTRSTRFIIDLLQAEYGPIRVLESRWRWIELPKQEWDLVVFLQHLPERLLLDSVTIRRVVLVPMYDDCSTDEAFWSTYRHDCAVLSFCRALSEPLEQWGHRVHRAQYFPPVPAESVDWSEGARSAFFWPRKPNLGWPVARRLLANWSWQDVHLHFDGTFTADRTRDITAADRARFPIRQTSWFADPREFRRNLMHSQVFLAPRSAEGIGMAFLEAMAAGMFVLAPDRPTMNEYIESGVNGFLYDPDAPAPPAWKHARKLGEAARTSIREGRNQWEASLPALQAFLRDPGLARSPGQATRASRDAERAARAQYRRARLTASVHWARSQIATPARAVRRQFPQ